MWCTQCKQDRPDDEFYQPKKRGWKCDKCDACVKENIRRYWHRVEMDPNKITGGDE